MTTTSTPCAVRFPSVRTSVAALLALGALFVPELARADTSCSHDSDCTTGFTCQASGVSACPPTPACPPGPACTTVAPDCTPETLYTCQPGPCTTDADCASGMVCHADTYESCGASGAVACAKGDECPPVPITPPTCTTVTEPSVCVPKYELPCKVDSDCGDHFTCVPDVTTVCSGSSGSGSGSGGVTGSGGSGGVTGSGGSGGVTGSGGSAGFGSATTVSGGSGSGASGSGGTTIAPSTGANIPVPAVDAGTLPGDVIEGGLPPPSCTTSTSSTSSCQADSIQCTTNSDCPATWTCIAPPVAEPIIGCVEPAEPVDGSAVPWPCDVDAALPAPGPSYCQPPYATSASVNGSAVAPTSSPVASGGQSAAGSNGGQSAGSSSGGSGGPVSAPATGSSVANGAGSTPAGSPGSHELDGVGCQMGASPARGSAGSLLSLIGLVGLAFRRRSTAT
ncbi:MAG: hypothetical protein ABSC94_13335 [Polyangiaceae bacterium]